MKSYSQQVLDQSLVNRHKWLDDIDRAPAPNPRGIKQEKESHLRAIADAQFQVKKLFSQREKLAAKPEDQAKEDRLLQAGSDDINSVPHIYEGEMHEALRVFRLLRPDAPVFYKEDAMLGMEAEMNKILAQKSGSRKKHLKKTKMI